MAKLKAKKKDEGQIEVALKYPVPLRCAAVNHVSMSRVAGEVQLDLSCINLRDLVSGIRSDAAKVEVQADVVFSCVLTPTAFLRLHRDVNTFYASFIEAGMIRDPEE